MTNNASQIEPWTPLGSLLESRSLLGALICTFLAPFGTPMGPQHVAIVKLILRPFQEPRFVDLGLRLGSQNNSKMKPKRGLFLFSTFSGPSLRYRFKTSFWSTLEPLGHSLGTPEAPQQAT